MKWIIVILSLLALYVFGQVIIEGLAIYDGNGSWAWLSVLLISNYILIYFIFLADRYKTAQEIVEIDREFEEVMKQRNGEV